MAAKFNIYCDEPAPSNQKHQQLATSSAIISTKTVATTTNPSATSSSLSSTSTNSTLSQLAATATGTLTNNKAVDLATAAQIQQHNAILMKREPLGIRQHLAQIPQHHQQQQQSSSQQSATSNHSADSKQDDDQENDISMASLGSDFVPSIVHDAEFDSFEYYDEDEDEILTSDESRLAAHDRHAGGGALNQHRTHQRCSEDNYSSLLLDDDEEFDDDDEELRLELRQAFKKHDDSQLFKSYVYIDDIERYLLDLESTTELRALPNYMTLQPEIDSKKRAILVNWLVEVSDEHDLESETLFICINIIDRFLSQMYIPISNLQLLGVAAMFIASKYEEIYPPFLHQLVEVTDDTYSGQQIRKMEQEILKALQFRISVPTVIYFLKRIFAYNKFSEKCYHLAEYLCYLSLLSDQPFLEYHPSEIALASVILAAHQIDAQSQKITPELKSAYDKSNQAQLERRRLPTTLDSQGVASKQCDIDRRAFIADKDLPFCIEALRVMQERAFIRSERNQQTDSAIYNKFASDTHLRVALMPPPSVEDLTAMA